MPRILITLCLVLLATLTLHAQETFRVPYAGAITDTSATVAVWMTGPTMFKLQIDTDPTLASPVETNPFQSRNETDNMTMAEIGDLLPGTRYYYRVATIGGEPLSRIQSFKTFPRAGDDAPVTIFFGSCQQSRTTDTGAVFNVAADLGGDIFVQLGDWAYPDIRVPGYPAEQSSMRDAYALRLDTAYPLANRLLAQMGMAYVWDDHDAYGDNSNGASSPDIKSRVLEAYKNYVPHYPLPNQSNGIWHSFVIGNAEIFMLDSRSQRRPVDEAFNGNKFEPGPSHSMLAGYPISGIDQRTWLLNAIRSSKARWKILANPVPFNPAMAPGITFSLLLGRVDVAKRFAEYWVGFPADVDSMKKVFNEGHRKNFLVITGSVHNNMYDDGSHSIVPEFVAANLDIENTHLYDSLKKTLNVWTAGQSNSESTIGRIRIETSPRHRMIIESFGESGTKLLSFEMVDSTSSGIDVTEESSDRWQVRSANAIGDELRLDMSHAPVGRATVSIFSIDGEKVMEIEVTLRGDDVQVIGLPKGLASGSYLGWVVVGEEEVGFRVNVVR